jgi:hypothetical protein
MKVVRYEIDNRMFLPDQWTNFIDERQIMHHLDCEIQATVTGRYAPAFKGRYPRISPSWLPLKAL